MNLSITLVTSLQRQRQRQGRKKSKDIMSYQDLGAWAPGEDPGTLYGDQRLNQRASPGDEDHLSNIGTFRFRQETVLISHSLNSNKHTVATGRISWPKRCFSSKSLSNLNDK